MRHMAHMMPIAIKRHAAAVAAGQATLYRGRLYTVVRAAGTDARAPVILEERALETPATAAVQLCLMSLDSVHRLIAESRRIPAA